MARSGMFHYGPYFFHRAFLRGSSPIDLFRSCLLLASPPVQPTTAMKSPFSTSILFANVCRSCWTGWPSRIPICSVFKKPKFRIANFRCWHWRNPGTTLPNRGMMPYNGVAILSREKPETVASGFDDGGESEDARLLRVVIDHHLIGILCPIFLIP